jgi:hypothetical protein
VRREFRGCSVNSNLFRIGHARTTCARMMPPHLLHWYWSRPIVIPGRDTTISRRFRFGMKSLWALVTIACVMLAMFAQPLLEKRRQQRLLNEVRASGVKISANGSVHRVGIVRGMLALFDSSYAQDPLYRIDCSGIELTEDDLEQLVRVKCIEQLNLSGTGFSDHWMRHLENLSHLTLLDVSGTQVTDVGIAQLSSFTHLGLLRVGKTRVTFAALEKLDTALPGRHFCEQRAINELEAAGIHVATFRHNALEGNGHFVQVGERAFGVTVGMKTDSRKTFSFAQAELLNYLDSLEWMDMYGVTFGPDALTMLRQLPKLRQIQIKNSNLNDRDLEAIGRQTQLVELSILESAITDAGLVHLKSLVNLKGLRFYGNTGVSHEAWSKLRRELPSLK